MCEVGGSSGATTRASRRGPEQAPLEQRRPEEPGLEQGSRGGAEADLPGRSRCLGLRGGARAGSADQQLAVDVRVADEEEVEVAAVHADRHPQHDRAGRGGQPADHAQRRPHPVGRAGCAVRVVVPLEEQQHGVAAPLDQVGAVVADLGEQAGERRAEDVAHLLGADLALARQPFGEPGEAGDVDEGDGPVHAHVPVVVTGGHPATEEPGDVRAGGLPRPARRDWRSWPLPGASLCSGV